MFQKSPLCGRGAHLFFCFYNPLAYIGSFFRRVKKKKDWGDSPKILLCCWASLGDLLLASSVLPAIRRRWPKAQIGFLCNPKSISVLQAQEGIQYIHMVSCFKKVGQNKMQTLFSLFHHSFFVYPKVIREIKKIEYDISLELYPFFPNTSPLARRASIPCRIGFASGGYESSMTDLVSFPSKISYLPCLYPLLLNHLDIDDKDLKAELCFSPEIFVLEERYLILHLGTSDPRKEWPPNQWKKLALELKKQGHILVFTGSGLHDRALIKEAGLEEVGINLLDRLSFSELATVIKKATALISIDSVPIHIAALLQVPFVALYLYSEGVDLWLPDSPLSALLIGRRCLSMAREAPHPRATYLEEIEPEHVLFHLSDLIKEF